MHSKILLSKLKPSRKTPAAASTGLSPLASPALQEKRGDQRRRPWSVCIALAFCFASLLAPLQGCGWRTESQVSNIGLPATRTLSQGELPRAGERFWATASKVFDGDTFEFNHEGVAYRVRLSGVDAPERTQPFSDTSRQALKSLLGQKAVSLEVLKTDVFKRFVAKVYVPKDGEYRDVSRELIKMGLGWHFKRYEKEQSIADRDFYHQDEVRAKQAGLGIWSEPNALAPWLFREQARAQQKALGGRLE